MFSSMLTLDRKIQSDELTRTEDTHLFNSLPSISPRMPGHCGNYGERTHLKTLVVHTGALSLTSTTVIVIVVSAEFAGVSTSLTRKFRLKSNVMVKLKIVITN